MSKDDKDSKDERHLEIMLPASRRVKGRRGQTLKTLNPEP